MEFRLNVSISTQDRDPYFISVASYRLRNRFSSQASKSGCPPFCYLGLVDVIVSAGIGSAHGHDNEISALDEIVVDWGLELVSMLLDPFAKVDWECDHCFNVEYM